MKRVTERVGDQSIFFKSGCVDDLGKKQGVWDLFVVSRDKKIVVWDSLFRDGNQIGAHKNYCGDGAIHSVMFASGFVVDGECVSYK